MGYASRGGYIGIACARTVVWIFLTNIVAICDDEGSAGGLFAKCTLHSSFRHPGFAAVWLSVVDTLIVGQLCCSVHNAMCGEIQSFMSNALAPLCAGITFAGLGITMGSLGAWWGVIGLPCFLLGPGIIVAVKGWSVLSGPFLLTLGFRLMHTWDIVTDFATSAIIGANSPMGAVYLSLASLNLCMFITSLSTDLGADSLIRVVVNLMKAIMLDMPMLVLDGILLAEGGRKPMQQAVIVVSGISSLFELFGSFKAAIDFHALSVHHAQMLQTVFTAEKVADALVHFDLDDAATALARAPDSQLTTAFSLLIKNLRMYRPYLPDTLFVTHPENHLDPELAQRPCFVYDDGHRVSRRKKLPGARHCEETANPLEDIIIQSMDDRGTPYVQPPRDLRRKPDKRRPPMQPRVPTPSGSRGETTDQVTLAPMEPPSIVLTGPPQLPLSLQTKTIAALVVRLLPGAREAHKLASQEIVESTTWLLSTVFIEAKSHRGVAHSFDTGFEVVLTFGSNSTSNPHVDAYECALSLHDRLIGCPPTHRQNRDVYIGLAYGKGVLGAVGAGGRLAYAVTGNVLASAREACDKAVLTGARVVSDEAMHSVIPPLHPGCRAELAKDAGPVTACGNHTFFNLTPPEALPASFSPPSPRDFIGTPETSRSVVRLDASMPVDLGASFETQIASAEPGTEPSLAGRPGGALGLSEVEPTFETRGGSPVVPLSPEDYPSDGPQTSYHNSRCSPQLTPVLRPPLAEDSQATP
ncbi:hypothetical protein DIPPA_22274 [Diplonema papillatum]|nr:hypothetical protein DIPPA_22274 [Diplonema papillatum]